MQLRHVPQVSNWDLIWPPHDAKSTGVPGTGLPWILRARMNQSPQDAFGAWLGTESSITNWAQLYSKPYKLFSNISIVTSVWLARLSFASLSLQSLMTGLDRPLPASFCTRTRIHFNYALPAPFHPPLLVLSSAFFQILHFVLKFAWH